MRANKPNTGSRGTVQTLFIGVCMFLVLALSACSSFSGGGARTLKQVDGDVSAALIRYHNAVSAGAVTLGERDQVNSAYASYKSAYQNALQAANKDMNTPAPDDVRAQATKLIGAVEAIPF